MELTRGSGILLHITSLPGGAFTGDLGPSAYAFADFLQEAGQAWWQTLPVNPIGPFSSPYSSASSFANEPLLISPELLLKDGLIRRRSLVGAPKRSTSWKASFSKSRRLRARLLQEAYATLKGTGPRSMLRAFRAFRKRSQSWLDDYALYRALSERFRSHDWVTWPSDVSRRETPSLAAARRELAGEIDYLAFEQFVFDRQWRALKEHCTKRGIGLIGDIPMFVSHESADVWANREAFLLDKRGRPRFVAGAPPDAFSDDGQRWGNALYDWKYHEQTQFAWWKARLARQLELFDVVRLDHFIGFRRYWRISAKAATAKGGRWISAPGDELFDELVRVYGGELPFVAEDLGSVNQEVWDLRDRYGLPGMKVLQFGFGVGEGPSIHLIHTYPTACVAYTGTHDSDTMLGWYRALRRRARAKDDNAKKELARAHAYLGTSRESEIVAAAIRMLLASPADTVILPMQDVLGLDGRHRMNKPATTSGNWVWRLKDGELSSALSARLRAMVEATDRVSV